MKLYKGIVAGGIGVLVVSVAVYAISGSITETNQTQLNQSSMNSHSEHNLNKQGQIENIPTMSGQQAFGTIQEIISILENDPKTDWSKVNISALQEHLIDMNELTLYTDVEEKVLENGLEMKVTGSGRTVGAIQRMVPTHVNMTLSEIEEWDVKVEQIDNGVRLTASSQNPTEAEHISGLGFIGLMATGANHPAHHLMMAKGEMH